MVRGAVALVLASVLWVAPAAASAAPTPLNPPVITLASSVTAQPFPEQVMRPDGTAVITWVGAYMTRPTTGARSMCAGSPPEPARAARWPARR